MPVIKKNTGDTREPLRSIPGKFSLSLRNRIAFSYSLATAVLLALVFTVIFFTVERVVYNHFDEELDREVSEILEKQPHGTFDIWNFDLSEDDNSSVEHGDHLNRKEHDENRDDDDEEFIQLVSLDGKVIAVSANLAGNTLTFQPGWPEKRFRSSIAGQLAVRQVQVPLTGQKGKPEGYLLAAVPVRDALIVLGDLKQVLLVSYPAIILTLFILTWLIAGRSIRPVEEVIAAAEKITRENLDQRNPLPRHHDELYRLSTTVNALLERLQDAFQREKQFTANASHELKTPIASVKGTLEVLVRKPREREHYEERILFCLKELDRMTKLIDQLLMLARYESSGLTVSMEPVNLAHHIREAIVRIRSGADQKNIPVSFDGPHSCIVWADPSMLDMIFENILSNAIKYSPSASTVAVSLSNRTGFPVCSIADNGIGIPEKQLSLVFERFYRVDESRNSKTGGFGLGLAIVKKLADLQHITVSVKSRADSGTTVELRFPHI
ncbi:MAG: HAMP domain-containing protein [Chlorobiaceae bacterium]|nr:HAMP domain-containing protein [Chlorobiaceae bacterium]